MGWIWESPGMYFWTLLSLFLIGIILLIKTVHACQSAHNMSLFCSPDFKLCWQALKQLIARAAVTQTIIIGNENTSGCVALTNSVRDESAPASARWHTLAVSPPLTKDPVNIRYLLWMCPLKSEKVRWNILLPDLSPQEGKCKKTEDEEWKVRNVRG